MKKAHAGWHINAICWIRVIFLNNLISLIELHGEEKKGKTQRRRKYHNRETTTWKNLIFENKNKMVKRDIQ